MSYKNLGMVSLVALPLFWPGEVIARSQGVLRQGRVGIEAGMGGVGLVVLPAAPATSQEAGVAPPQAVPEDVESVESIVAAVYDVISGPAGKKRDWERWRSLFIPEAKLIPVLRQQEGEGLGYRALSPEDYVQTSGPRLEESGFFEQEVHRVVEQFGPIAHVFSTYESRRREDDVKPFARGINSFQLMHDGKRWWVVNIFWTSERPELPIPPEYLH